MNLDKNLYKREFFPQKFESINERIKKSGSKERINYSSRSFLENSIITTRKPSLKHTSSVKNSCFPKNLQVSDSFETCTFADIVLKSPYSKETTSPVIQTFYNEETLQKEQILLGKEISSMKKEVSEIKNCIEQIQLSITLKSIKRNNKIINFLKNEKHPKKLKNKKLEVIRKEFPH